MDVIRLGVDVGGTFTDVVLLVDGAVTTAKVPTTDDQSEGVLDGIRTASEAAGIETGDIAQFRHAMTVATNALLEGEGSQTALVTTEGFRDVLAIGRQDRPALYDLDASKPAPLVPRERRYEVGERATTERVAAAVDEAELREIAADIDDETESIAVSFLHAYAHPRNEERAAEVLREVTDARVVASHEVLPEFREYERTATTAADAAVGPVIGEYLRRLERRATEAGIDPPRIMKSNGGITDVAGVRRRAVTTALSGPAAGVVGASLFDSPAHDGLITFDMGGTSSDVSLVRDGDVERTTEAIVGGHPIHVPMVDVETIGAGGGSIAWVDEGGALRVGPHSAGAEPGPACYGNGGEAPTVTDANLLLGYLGADTELGEGLTLDATAAEAACERVVADSTLEEAVEAARGIYRVANERMARALRTVTVREGYDPAAFALVAFGGAGPMHAAALADRLGVEQIRVPLANGVLSALGLLAADERHDTSRTVRVRLAAADPQHIESQFAALAESARERSETRATRASRNSERREPETRFRDHSSDGAAGESREQATAPETATVARQADVRYAGQSHELTVAVGEPVETAALAERFHQRHEQLRGYRLADEPIEVVTLRATAVIPGSEPVLTHEGNSAEQTGTREAFFDGEFRETPVYARERLPTGTEIAGPAICEGGESTVVVPPRWRAAVTGRGTLVLEGKQ